MHAMMREGLRLRSIRLQDSFPFRRERRIPLDTRSILFTFLTAPGNPSLILGVMIGARHETPNIYIVESDTYVAYSTLYAEIADDMARRMDDDAPPQIIVGSRSDAKALAAIADSLGSWSTKYPTVEQLIAIRGFGARLAYPTIVRAAVAHRQAALITLADELSEHYATPISDSEREHLGVHLAWLRAGSPGERTHAAAKALQDISDHQPLGTLDDTITATRDRLYKAQKNTDNVEEIREARETFQALILNVLQSLRRLQEEAFDLLYVFEEGPCAQWFRTRERDLFQHARRNQQRCLAALNASARGADGYTHPIRTTGWIVGSMSPEQKITRLYLQEYHQKLDDSALLEYDPILRAGGRVSGEIFTGHIVESVETELNRKTVWHVSVQTNQQQVALDEGDRVRILDRNIKGRVAREPGLEEDPIYSFIFERNPGEPGTILEIAEEPFRGKIREMHQRRIGRPPRRQVPEGQIPDPAVEPIRDEIPTSRFQGPSWTHDEAVPRPAIPAIATPADRVDHLLTRFRG